MDLAIDLALNALTDLFSVEAHAADFADHSFVFGTSYQSALSRNHAE